RLPQPARSPAAGAGRSPAARRSRPGGHRRRAGARGRGQPRPRRLDAALCRPGARGRLRRRTQRRAAVLPGLRGVLTMRLLIAIAAATVLAGCCRHDTKPDLPGAGTVVAPEVVEVEKRVYVPIPAQI